MVRKDIAPEKFIEPFIIFSKEPNNQQPPNKPEGPKMVNRRRP